MNPLKWVRVIGMEDLLSFFKASFEVLRDWSVVVRWIVMTVFPYALAPALLLGPVAGILLNTEMWETFDVGLDWVQSMITTSTGEINPWLARMNYIFPVSEAFLMVGLVLVVHAYAAFLALVKSVLKLLLDLIPF